MSTPHCAVLYLNTLGTFCVLNSNETCWYSYLNRPTFAYDRYWSQTFQPGTISTDLGEYYCEVPSMEVPTLWLASILLVLFTILAVVGYTTFHMRKSIKEVSDRIPAIHALSKEKSDKVIIIPERSGYF